MILLNIFLCFFFPMANSIKGDAFTLKDNVNDNPNTYIEAVKQFTDFNPSADLPVFETNDILKYVIGQNNEDRFLNGSQLIKKYGYPVEIHHIQTIDGYILTLLRIPGTGPPVFLMHGLIQSSDDYIIAGPESAIGYSLANEGYDVWMGNSRGNKYSRKHVTLSPDKDRKFWDFSWHEIGIIDVPTMIDYVLNITGYLKLMYIGHSRGTTSFFVMCSEKPEYNDKVSIMISMATVAYASHLRSPVIKALCLFEDQEYFVLETLGLQFELLPSNLLTNSVKTILCGNTVLATTICSNLLFPIFGYDYAQLNITNLPNIIEHQLAGSSAKELFHLIQVHNSGIFRKYNYNKIKNMELYGTSSAPAYPLEKVTAPIFMFYSDNDWLAAVTDVKLTRSRLPNVIEFYRIPYKKFNHLDYLWAKDLKTLVYYNISQTLNKYRSATLKV